MPREKLQNAAEVFPLVSNGPAVGEKFAPFRDRHLQSGKNETII